MLHRHMRSRQQVLACSCQGCLLAQIAQVCSRVPLGGMSQDLRSSFMLCQ